jgi:transposase-like protein
MQLPIHHHCGYHLPRLPHEPYALVPGNAAKGAEIHTDEFGSYLWLDSSEFAHEAVNHGETYVRYRADGEAVHTNGCENVWSLFKRGIMGVFHKVSAKYLPLYLNEFEFRFNNRDEFNMMDRVLSECF